jgi:hypothetical protein
MTPPTEQEPLTIWAVHTTFRKNGSPIMGTIGPSVAGVIVMRSETWKELCERVPALQTMEFRVGSFE